MAGSTRRDFVKAVLAMGVASPIRAGAAEGKEGSRPMAGKRETVRGTPGRMPVLFVGHGSPMNAIEDNRWSRGFRSLTALLPRPRAVLAVSAHWFVPGTFLTGNPRPETIHDFYGFPEELGRVRYPAPGDPDLARRAVALVGDGRASTRQDWGLDHGAWSVLRHLFPEADVPVVQLSIDGRLPPAGHLALGRSLSPLRDEGVLILGSGNATHNLRHAFGAASRGDRSTPSWAREFDEATARALEGHDAGGLAGALETEAGKMAHPTPDHYLPLLYVAGAADPADPVRFPIEGFEMGSLSMRAALVG
jgi:4,5-DOPA dioxygenase extradiol